MNETFYDTDQLKKDAAGVMLSLAQDIVISYTNKKGSFDEIMSGLRKARKITKESLENFVFLDPSIDIKKIALVEASKALSSVFRDNPEHTENIKNIITFLTDNEFGKIFQVIPLPRQNNMEEITVFLDKREEYLVLWRKASSDSSQEKSLEKKIDACGQEICKILQENEVKESVVEDLISSWLGALSLKVEEILAVQNSVYEIKVNKDPSTNSTETSVSLGDTIKNQQEKRKKQTEEQTKAQGNQEPDNRFYIVRPS